MNTPLLGIASFALTQPASYSEAPSLAAQVAAGELPPVEERLPVNPLVVEPVERVGSYGGTWRTGLVGGGDSAWLHRTLFYENLLRRDPAWREIKSYRTPPSRGKPRAMPPPLPSPSETASAGAMGKPFTADDIVFWYEAMFLNESLTPVKPDWLMSEGEPVVVEQQDEHTVVFRFAGPKGLFLQDLANRDGELPTRYPRHYFERFHADYNPDVDTLVAEAGVSDWVALFNQRGSAPPSV